MNEQYKFVITMVGIFISIIIGMGVYYVSQQNYDYSETGMSKNIDNLVERTNDFAEDIMVYTVSMRME